LTSLQISYSTGIAEVLEFSAKVKRTIVSQNAIPDKLMFILELDFELVLAEYHF
jgi:hypothetical protein